MAYGGLPFLGTSCPVSKFGFDYSIDLYQMLEMITIGLL